MNIAKVEQKADAALAKRGMTGTISTTSKFYDDGSFRHFLTTIDSERRIFSTWKSNDTNIVFQSYDGCSDENNYEFEI